MMKDCLQHPRGTFSSHTPLPVRIRILPNQPLQASVMCLYPEILGVTLRIGSRILRVLPLVLSSERTRAYRLYELTPAVL